MEKDNEFFYDSIVIGAGHAGCEAALALARTGQKTLLLTLNLDAIAFLACNPSIGGTAKGHLVCEIDALGGQMGINADKTALQIRMLNMGKGPAVHSLRAQADKINYHNTMKRTLKTHQTYLLGNLKRLKSHKKMAMFIQSKPHKVWSSFAIVLLLRLAYISKAASLSANTQKTVDQTDLLLQTNSRKVLWIWVFKSKDSKPEHPLALIQERLIFQKQKNKMVMKTFNLFHS